jgi:hypothetical protein
MKPSRLVTCGGVRRHTVRGMRKITKAALVGGAAAAAIAATVGVAAPANASTDREQAFLNQFVATGGYIYDANQLTNTGYRICARFDYVDGNQIAREVFADSSWGDVPNLHEAARWVRVAANTLCPEVWDNPAVRSIY